ncbi:MAG: YiaA/YiaB family inner membrane protein [Pseudomonadota bacterium]
MTEPNIQNTAAWKTFTIANFGISMAMMGIGIFFLPLDLATKGFLTMATLMIVQSAITVTKTIRDEQESKRLVHRIEDAKTEKLLMDIGRKEAA